MFLRLLLSTYLLMRRRPKRKEYGGERRPPGLVILGRPRPPSLEASPGQGCFVFVVFVEGESQDKKKRCKKSQCRVEDRGGPRSLVKAVGRQYSSPSEQRWGIGVSVQGPHWGKDAQCKSKPLSPFVWVTLHSTLLILLQRPWSIWKSRLMFRSRNLSLSSTRFCPVGKWRKPGSEIWGFVMHIQRTLSHH